MAAETERKTSRTLDIGPPKSAGNFGVTGSAVAEAAPVVRAGADASRRAWLAEHAAAFAAQSDWHDSKGHPLAEIMAAPGGSSWLR